MAFTWAVESGAWDLSIVNGKLTTVSGAEEVKQRILISLWHYWEEYFLNVPDGVPWYELILGSKNKQLVESLIRRAILDVPGVISIINFKLQSSLGQTTLRDFAIFCDVEVVGGVVSIFTTVPAEPEIIVSGANALTLIDGSVLTTANNAFLTT